MVSQTCKHCLILLHLRGRRMSRAVNLLMSPAENSGCYREECAMPEGGKEGSHGLCREGGKKGVFFPNQHH